MAKKDNIQITRQLFDEVFSGGNVNLCDQYLSESVKFHDIAAENDLTGLKEFQKMENKYQKAFPDKYAKIDQIFGMEDKVVVLWTMNGTHEGNLEDIPATHNPIEISGISIYQFKNNKIIEVWQIWNRLGLLEQLGTIELRQRAMRAA